MSTMSTFVQGVAALLSSPGVERLGMTLLHFVWQGALIALGFLAVRYVLARRSSDVRYVAACVALVAMAIAPIVTFGVLSTSDDAVSHAVEPAGVAVPTSHAAPASDAPALVTVPPHTAGRGAPAPAAVAPIVALCWVLGVALLSLRLAGGLVTLRHLVTRRVDATNRALSQRTRAIARRLGVTRHVRVALSRTLTTPILVGWVRPLVLLPVSSVTALAPDEIDAVLAHELAHVKRHDYLANLAQCVIETLLFYHPAVWWVSSVVRAEREHACDDVAVSVTGDPLGYAKTLLALEEARVLPAPAASGGDLGARIRRLAGVPSSGRRAGAAAGVVLLAATILSGAFLATSSAQPGSDSVEQTMSAERFPARETIPPELLRALERGEYSRRWDGGLQETTWRSRGWRLRVVSDGLLVLDAETGTIERMSPGSSLEVEERERSGITRRLEAAADESGRPAITYSAREGTRTVHIEDVSPEGAAWFASLVPHLVESGVDAFGRARKLYDDGGVEAVLGALHDLRSDGVRAVYLQILIEAHEPTAEEVIAIRRAIGAEIESDGTTASLFVALLARRDKAVSAADARDAIELIESDGTRADVIIDLMYRDLLSVEDAMSLIPLIRSDGTRASVLLSLTEMDDPGRFAPLVVEHLGLIESDGTLASVLTSLVDNEAIDAEQALDVARRHIESDGTLASLIVNVAERDEPSEDSRRLVLDALGALHSDGTLASTIGHLIAIRWLTPAQGFDLAAREIASDGTRSSLIVQIAHDTDRDAMNDEMTQRAFIASVRSIDSEGTLASAIVTLVDLDALTAIDALELAADRIGSSGTLGTLIERMADRVAGDEEGERAYMNAVEAVSSRHTRARLRERLEDAR